MEEDDYLGTEMRDEPPGLLSVDGVEEEGDSQEDDYDGDNT